MTYKKILYLLRIILPVGAILRILQYYFAIDPQTGYYQRQNATVTMMYIFIAACFAIFMSLLLNDENKTTVKLNHLFIISAPEIVLAFITAAFYFVYSIIFPFMEISEQSSPDLKNLLLILFGLISAVFFVLFALKDRQYYQKSFFKFLVLCPVAFFLIKLVTVFNQLTMEANVSSYTLELIELAGFVFFFMNLAKYMLSGNNIRSLFIYGLWSVTSVAISSVPAVVLPVLPGNLYKSSQPPILEIMYLLTGIFIFMFLYKIGNTDFRNLVEEVPSDENAESDSKDFSIKTEETTENTESFLTDTANDDKEPFFTEDTNQDTEAKDEE